MVITHHRTGRYTATDNALHLEPNGVYSMKPSEFTFNAAAFAARYGEEASNRLKEALMASMEEKFKSGGGKLVQDTIKKLNPDFRVVSLNASELVLSQDEKVMSYARVK